MKGQSRPPEGFLNFVGEVFGEAGKEWAARLPELLDECTERWSLRLLPPYHLSYNYVAPAIRTDGSEVVLKAGVPNNELTCEVEALRWFDGQGVVRLLEAIPEQGIMLLERVRPGVPLLSQTDRSLAADDRATRILAGMMRRIYRPITGPHPFHTLDCWTSGLSRIRTVFDGGTGPFPEDLVDRAERLFIELIASAGEAVLLHADLHHENVLTAEREPWLVIDPKGVVGDRAYEVIGLMHNALPPDPADYEKFLARRTSILAEELEFDRQRLLQWSVAHTVLSAWWSFEENSGGWEEELLITRALLKLL